MLYSGGGQPGEKADSCPKATSPLLIGGKSFSRGASGVHRWREGTSGGTGAVSSDSLLELSLAAV